MLRSRSTVYWPGLYAEIEEMTRQSEICREYQSTQTKELMIPSDVPPQLWHTVGTDLFYFNGKDYLLVCDYSSKFPFVRPLPQNCSSEAVIDQVKQIFSEQGIPLIV